MVLEEFAGVVARAVVELGRDIESLRGRIGESARQVEGLFESLMSARELRLTQVTVKPVRSELAGVEARAVRIFESKR